MSQANIHDRDATAAPTNPVELSDHPGSRRPEVTAVDRSRSRWLAFSTVALLSAVAMTADGSEASAQTEVPLAADLPARHRRVASNPAATESSGRDAATCRERPILDRCGGHVPAARRPEAGGAGRAAVRLPHRRERVQAQQPPAAGRASSTSPRRTGSSTSPGEHR